MKINDLLIKACEAITSGTAYVVTFFSSVEVLIILQGVPIENCQKYMDVELKLCISDPTLVKPKCV